MCENLPAPEAEIASNGKANPSFSNIPLDEAVVDLNLKPFSRRAHGQVEVIYVHSFLLLARDFEQVVKSAAQRLLLWAEGEQQRVPEASRARG